MKDSSMTTELDDILMSIEETGEELCFYLDVMRQLNLEIPEYSSEEQALIRKCQREEVSESEKNKLEVLLTAEREVLDNQEDMVRSFLAQCNRNTSSSALNLH